MTEASLESLLAQWAARRLGFDPRSLRLERLNAVAQAQAERLGGLGGLEAALRHGQDSVAEEALVAAATVGETYFFRQHEHFDLLADMKAPANGALLAWSAGCSSGEEAYSLAGTLRQRFGLETPALTVWGTDINAKALEAARRAEYGRWSWRQSGGASAEARGALAMQAESRACVRFARHNLLSAPVFDLGLSPAQAPERFDLVFCRNVLVYFSPSAAAEAVAHFRAALKPGGWLVLGNMDLGGAALGFKRIGPPALCVYEKLAAQSPRPAAPSAPPAPAPKRPAQPLEALDPVEWHKAILAELELGHSAQALQELQHLAEAMPDYLPGLFELALALRRSGKNTGAIASLRRVLGLAQGRPLSAIVPGPEALSLDYYVSSAQSFLDSNGDAP